MDRKRRHNLFLGLAFLGPNILGFLAFTIIPLAFSLVLAFSNWDLRLHNMFKDEPIKFVGLANFVRLISVQDFWRFLGNTLFFMMGIPFSIAASLAAATLLSQDLRGGSRTVYVGLIAGAIFVASVLMLGVVGAGGAGMIIVLSGLVCGILVCGVAGGTTLYRTLFYIPHFTSGVATFILWKKLYSPHTGPISNFLAPSLDAVSEAVNTVPSILVQAGLWGCFGLIALLLWVGLRRLRLMWTDGELGWLGVILSAGFLVYPTALAPRWSPSGWAAILLVAVAVCLLGQQMRYVGGGRDFICARSEGIGTALTFSVALMVAQFVLLGLGIVFHRLPEMAQDGLQPPEWLTQYHWAKPAIMIMAFWSAVGSNNMLLYLAGLSNVPTELYEAADIDGASRFQRFWHVTWPQLAPTTFFIVVMSMIGGLQGGFEMARTMTQGGPAGGTTTLSYFIYMEGFETGRLGYSSAVAWMLFLMVFLMTLFNWRFGSRYVNE